jgi:hypothetical protein
MFTVDKYRFGFGHVAFEEPKKIVRKFGQEAWITHTTACWVDVLVDDEYDLMATGITACSIEDVFEKSEGRKKALTRALEKAGFDREFRTQVWKKYWSMVKA